MNFNYHCEECKKKLGQPFAYVHSWLDKFMHDESLSLYERTKHRKFRHNREGVETIRKMYGDEAAQAAELHIVSDLKADGNWDGHTIPCNKEEYEEADLW